MCWPSWLPVDSLAARSAYALRHRAMSAYTLTHSVHHPRIFQQSSPADIMRSGRSPEQSTTFPVLASLRCCESLYGKQACRHSTHTLPVSTADSCRTDIAPRSIFCPPLVPSPICSARELKLNRFYFRPSSDEPYHVIDRFVL